MEPGRLCKGRQDVASAAYRASFPGFARLTPLFFFFQASNTNLLNPIHIGLDKSFSDLHRIQGGALAQIIGHHP